MVCRSGLNCHCHVSTNYHKLLIRETILSSIACYFNSLGVKFLIIVTSELITVSEGEKATRNM